MREYTKRFEQQVRGTPAAVLASLERPPRGEIAIVLAAREAPSIPAEPADTDAAIDRALAEGSSAPAIARDLAKRGFGARADLYRRVAERRRRPPE